MAPQQHHSFNTINIAFESRLYNQLDRRANHHLKKISRCKHRTNPSSSIQQDLNTAHSFCQSMDLGKKKKPSPSKQKTKMKSRTYQFQLHHREISAGTVCAARTFYLMSWFFEEINRRFESQTMFGITSSTSSLLFEHTPELEQEMLPLQILASLNLYHCLYLRHSKTFAKHMTKSLGKDHANKLARAFNLA